ncbi:MAG: hypothetical protein AAGD40_01505, partial [Pseudomonadota bacterium]
DALDFDVAVDPDAVTASGTLHSEAQEFALRPDRVSYGRHAARLEGRELHRHPGGLCVESDALATWFDVQIKPSLESASLAIRSRQQLPVERAAIRERRRAALGRGSAAPDLAARPVVPDPYRLWRTPSVDIVASLGASRDAGSRSGEFEARYGLFAAGELARLSYDARLGSDADGVPETLRVRAYRQDADGRLFGALGATEAVVGDVSIQRIGLVAPSAVGRGAWIANTPLVRAPDFDTTAFFGELPAGWEAELYRNGALIAFAEPDETGRYAFEDVPLLYGENRFEIVRYGPQGQERRQTVFRRVGEDAVPAGDTWYRAGVIEDGRDLIDIGGQDRLVTRLQAFAGVEHGLSRRLSVGLSAQAIEDDDGEIDGFLEADLRANLGPALVELDLVGADHGGVAAGVRVAGRIGTTSIFASSIVQDGIDTPQIDDALVSEHELRAIRDFDLGDVFATASAYGRYTDRSGPPDRAELGASVALRHRGIAVTQDLTWQREGIIDDRLEGRTQIGGRVAGAFVRGEVRYTLSGGADLDEASLTAAHRIGRTGQVRGELGFDAQLDEGTLSLGYSERFHRFALGAKVEADTDGGVAAGLNLALSVGPGQNGRFARISGDPMAATGQVAARVFTDENADGLYQEGEPLLEGVRVRTAGRADHAETGREGRAHLIGLPIGRRVLVGLDAGSVDDPLLKPVGDGVVIIPRRGVATPVDLPLLPTGEIEGTLFHNATVRPGAELVLRDAGGTEVAALRTDYDGYFLFENVAYGAYSLELRAESAAILNVPPRLLSDLSVDASVPVLNVGDVHAGGALDVAAADIATEAAATGTVVTEAGTP